MLRSYFNLLTGRELEDSFTCTAITSINKFRESFDFKFFKN